MQQTGTRELIAGRYRLEERHPVEGFSSDSPIEIYNAVDEPLERPVTVQMLSDQAARSNDIRRIFLRHGQLAASLHHPYVDGVYDAGEWQGRLFWVMARTGELTAASLYKGSSRPPDVAGALLVTRQAAQALQAARDAGLTDWTFSHQAVRLSPQGDVRLAILEGLDRLPGAGLASSKPEDDPSALGALLRLMLVGRADTGAIVSGLPLPIVALLDRMQTGGLTGAGNVAAAISGIEAAATQPTEAYQPGQQPNQPPSVTPVPLPYYGPSDGESELVAVPPASTVEFHNAPTLAATAVSAPARDAAPAVAQPYVPPAPAQARQRRLLPVIPVVLLLLLGGVALALALRPTSAAGTAPATRTGVVAAPDLRRKSLAEAETILGAAGLRLARREPMYNADVPTNAVALQEPDPGTPLQSDDIVTVTLSLGAQTPPTSTAVRPSPTQAPKQQPAANPTPPASAPKSNPNSKPPSKEEEKDREKKDK